MSEIDDPQAFVDKLPDLRPALGQLCSAICPNCGTKKRLLRNWPDDFNLDMSRIECDKCGTMVPLRYYFAESEPSNIDDVDADHYLSTSFESPVPGYKIEQTDPLPAWGALGQHPFAVYNLKGAFLGHIMYDPENDVPATANPEWKGMHWLATVGSRDNESKFCKTYKEAAMFVIDFKTPIHSTQHPADKVAETLLETNLSDPESAQAEPDDIDPEAYLNEINPGVAELKKALSGLYDRVKVHLRDPHFSFFANEKEWIVACRRERPMPYPAAVKGSSQGSQFRAIVADFFREWASNAGLVLDDFKTHGMLRKNVTFTFKARPANSPIAFRRSESIDDENEFLSDYVTKVNWDKELMEALWQFHPAGTCYTVTGTEHFGVISASLYFPPERDNFANRMYDFVLSFLRGKNFNVTSLNMWLSKDPEAEYPRWHILVVFNAPTLSPIGNRTPDRRLDSAPPPV